MFELPATIRYVSRKHHEISMNVDVSSIFYGLTEENSLRIENRAAILDGILHDFGNLGYKVPEISSKVIYRIDVDDDRYVPKTVDIAFYTRKKVKLDEMKNIVDRLLQFSNQNYLNFAKEFWKPEVPPKNRLQRISLHNELEDFDLKIKWKE